MLSIPIFKFPTMLFSFLRELICDPFSKAYDSTSKIPTPNFHLQGKILIMVEYQFIRWRNCTNHVKFHQLTINTKGVTRYFCSQVIRIRFEKWFGNYWVQLEFKLSVKSNSCLNNICLEQLIPLLSFSFFILLNYIVTLNIYY